MSVEVEIPDDDPDGRHSSAASDIGVLVGWGLFFCLVLYVLPGPVALVVVLMLAVWLLHLLWDHLTENETE